MTIAAEQERDGEPDFFFSFETGETLGVEITEAGKEADQAWQTRTEKKTRTGHVELLPGDGIVDRVEIGNVADQIAGAIENKIEQYRNGKYRRPDECDLALYDNTLRGGFLDKSEIVDRVRRKKALSEGFRAIHIVFHSHVAVDALGDGYQLVDIAKRYESDFVEWLFDQADRLRRRGPSGIDGDNIAEELETLGRSERRALRSHMRNRLIHMIKWEFQPERRSRSCYASLRTSLSGMEDKIAISPSLGTKEYLQTVLDEIYPEARAQALRETGLSPEAVMVRCPFAVDQIFDATFTGVEPDED